MATQDTSRLVFSVEEARKQLGLSRGLVYEAIRRGEIPSIRIGRRILIPCAALERLLREATTRHSI
jgi:excisionase family DNA binding protein